MLLAQSLSHSFGGQTDTKNSWKRSTEKSAVHPSGVSRKFDNPFAFSKKKPMPPLLSNNSILPSSCTVHSGIQLPSHLIRSRSKLGYIISVESALISIRKNPAPVDDKCNTTFSIS